MGMMDKAKAMADKAMHGGKTQENIDKAADKADEMTGHKYSDKIDKGADMAKQAGQKGQQQGQQQ